MALSYNLKYQKQNAFAKVVLEKEGEVVIDRQSFRLKGKGAQDQGEVIYFAEIKDLAIRDESLVFSTFYKEHYILGGFLNLFDSFLKDFFRVRNEYLADALFMKVGMLFHEYDGYIEVTNHFGKSFQKGKCRIQFYEGSILILPEKNDCCVLYFNFLKSHEFDEDEYVLKLSSDDGSVITISKLGTNFEDVEETLESLLGKMYEKVVNHLKEVLPDFDAVTLLKLAFVLREGKCVQVSALKKIHEDLPRKIEELALQSSDASLREKIKFLRSKTEDMHFYIGLSLMTKTESRDVQIRSWFLIALPQYNLVVIGVTSNPHDHGVYFFRIAVENGDVQEKLSEKIIEVNQVMYLVKFDMNPLYKDKHLLKKTKYRAALRKLPCLRLLRKSYIGKSVTTDITNFENDFERFSKFSKVMTPSKPPRTLERSQIL